MTAAAVGCDMTLTPVEVRRYYAVRLPDCRLITSREWRCPCPVHQGDDDNFSIEAATGRWYCHSQCGRGGDVYQLEMALTGADFRAAAESVHAIVGRGARAEWLPRGVPSHACHTDTYRYTDEKGGLLYEVLRYQWSLPGGGYDKTFRQRRPDGRGGWTWNMRGVRRVLYRLPEIIEAPICFVTEGEKDAEILRDFGFCATTNAGGAMAPWLPEYTGALTGREVIVIPHRDVPGRKRVASIVRALFGHVARLIVLDLEHAGNDVHDWFSAGHSELELITLVEGEGVTR